MSANLPLLCPACGYDLRATTEARCPECGGAIDDEVRSGEATIPWQQSRRLGRVRGFFATIAWALFHPTRLAQQAGRRVDYRAARWFQLICCLIGAISLAAVLTVDLWMFRNRIVAAGPPWTTPSYAVPGPTAWEVAGDVAILVSLWIALFAWLVLGSGVPSYFFHRRELPMPLQNRAVALSYYGAAPLVLLAPTAGLVWGAVKLSALLNDANAQMESPVLEGLARAVAGAIVLWCIATTWLLPGLLLARGSHASTGRVVALLATTALSWPLLLGLTILLLPIAVFYLQFLWALLR